MANSRASAWLLILVKVGGLSECAVVAVADMAASSPNTAASTE
jgi:hypothetical protein